jgi:hypothetical protein
VSPTAPSMEHWKDPDWRRYWKKGMVVASLAGEAGGKPAQAYVAVFRLYQSPKIWMYWTVQVSVKKKRPVLTEKPTPRGVVGGNWCRLQADQVVMTLQE